MMHSILSCYVSIPAMSAYSFYHAIMVALDVSISTDSPDESFGDTIEISVDVTHPLPVTLAVFPVLTIVMRIAQHGEGIQGIHEELSALRDREDVAEAERATLYATIRSMGEVEMSLHNCMMDKR
nr:hypothetical protein [Tanacetum cinerariifolium]